MQHQYTNAVIKKKCLSRGMLSGIFRIPSRCCYQIKVVILDLLQNLTSISKAVRFQIKFAMTSLYNSGFSARSVIPTLRAANYAGYSGRNGFTLIELLVVVLIIGILAAIALPQYNKAVAKSRGVQVIAFLNAYAKAADTLRLSGTSTCENMDDFDIDLTTAFTHFKQLNTPDPGEALACDSFVYTGNSFDLVFQRINQHWEIAECSGWDATGTAICEYLTQHL